jgi:serine/threonine-protein kinase
LAEVPEGTVVDGRYRVVSRLGSGGMADVYCAEDTHLGRQVALKILSPRFAQDQQFVERFKREAQAAAGLTHPNVVNVYDRGEHDGTYYIAMEYLPGSTLKDVVLAHGQLPQENVIEIGVQILRAAGFAHKRGIIHRDLKPHNVMLDDAGNAKVTDFGIARAGASEMTEAGSVMGTAQYLSPEQAQGQQTNAQSDIYSIGIILYELLTGQLPFEGDSAVSIAVQHLNDPPTPIRQLRPDVSPALEQAVMRALAKDPAARWQDADDFAAALEAARPTLGTAAVGQDTAAFVPVAATQHYEEEEEEPGRRWPWIALGLTALLLGLAALLLLGGEQKDVPGVTGQPLEIATDTLEDEGFEVEVDRRPDLAPVDQVIDQTPNAGTRADEGSTVTLVVSSGPGQITVPTVDSFSEKRAVKELTMAGCGDREDTTLCGFKVEVREQASDDVDEGKAIRTSPRGGTQAEVGSRVLLFISSGPKQVEVPDVIGLERESAQSTLDRAGLGFTVREEESDSEPGTVLEQDPAAGTVVDKGSRVQITVAKEREQVEVPPLVGFSQETAEEELRDLGLEPVVVEEETDNPEEEGDVLDQAPTAGTEVDPGSRVRIFIGTIPDGGVIEEGGDEQQDPLVP